MDAVVRAVIEHTDGTKLQVDVVGLDLTELTDTRQVVGLCLRDYFCVSSFAFASAGAMTCSLSCSRSSCGDFVLVRLQHPVVPPQ